MEIIIHAFPTIQITINVVQDITSQFIIENRQVGYSDFLATMKELELKYMDLKAIYLFGPLTYIEGLAHELDHLYENKEDLEINIMVDESIPQEFVDNFVSAQEQSEPKLLGV